VVPGGAGWCRVVPGAGAGWCRVVPDGAGWCCADLRQAGHIPHVLQGFKQATCLAQLITTPT